MEMDRQCCPTREDAAAILGPPSSPAPVKQSGRSWHTPWLRQWCLWWLALWAIRMHRHAPSCLKGNMKVQSRWDARLTFFICRWLTIGRLGQRLGHMANCCVGVREAVWGCAIAREVRSQPVQPLCLLVDGTGQQGHRKHRRAMNGSLVARLCSG